MCDIVNRFYSIVFMVKNTPNTLENEFQNWSKWVFRVMHIVEYSLGGVFKPGFLGVFVIEKFTFSSLVYISFANALL